MDVWWFDAESTYTPFIPPRDPVSGGSSVWWEQCLIKAMFGESII